MKSEAIRERIVELATLRLQRKLWLNEDNDTGLISSYSELMCSLFDDLEFEQFVQSEICRDYFSQSLVLELDKLRDSLNSYIEKGSDEEIIDDPEWLKVVGQAKKVIEEWKE